MEQDIERNLNRVEQLVRSAAKHGAQIIALPELFQTRYFPQREDARFFDLARPATNHPVVERFARVAQETNAVLPVSFFERDGQEYFNSVAVVDADGSVLGTYRKSHIPDGPGYEEKFYFRPGNTGFRVWTTQHATLGVGICWDQWFPECARAMALMGAEVLLYPTAIGSEPQNSNLDTRAPWRRVMVGHAVANHMPVLAANRVGTEDDMTFYGNSFIVDPLGELRASLDDEKEGFALAEFDLPAIARSRAEWGFFRDRRPDLYQALVNR